MVQEGKTKEKIMQGSQRTKENPYADFDGSQNEEVSDGGQYQDDEKPQNKEEYEYFILSDNENRNFVLSDNGKSKKVIVPISEDALEDKASGSLATSDFGSKKIRLPPTMQTTIKEEWKPMNEIREEQEEEEFIPYLHERSTTGRSAIPSVKNLVTKAGAHSLIKKVTLKAKKNYRFNKQVNFGAKSLRGLGIDAAGDGGTRTSQLD